ncbi:hypothetical protein EV580_1317 [Mycobacterium sp. BK086]|uniref:hypothetical protein n=1 Tax=Mycobacterium sp. BK086 TaxID=2512165 RepID=UPI00105F6493|nr:hypothetical protein [Mycobacterium sp. BK086]TDO18135.1 hypothetical protein EV580_1317 [Mycobacterium sp. BK086]
MAPKRYGRLSELSVGLVAMADDARAIGSDFERTVDSLMTLTAVQGAERMKEHAPWRDSTGNRDDRTPGETRAALFTAPELAGSHKSILFSHGVDWGIWLEISNHGKDQIIMPTVAYMGRKLMKSLRGSLTALRKR